MHCPFCDADKESLKVIDSRTCEGGRAIRRRRECLKCNKRFTTYERIEEMLPQVCKKDGRREPFDRLKIINGIVKACEKRPISKADIELLVDRLETRLQESTEREISTTTIGEWVMKELHGMDEVAYVRFASVYRSFRDISEFMQELQELLKK